MLLESNQLRCLTVRSTSSTSATTRLGTMDLHTRMYGLVSLGLLFWEVYYRCFADALRRPPPRPPYISLCNLLYHTIDRMHRWSSLLHQAVKPIYSNRLVYKS